MDIPNTDSVNYAFASAQSQAMQYRHEFITPEHLLSALLKQVPFQKALAECFCTPEELSQSISEYLSKEVERVPQEIEYELEISGQLSELLQYAYMTISHSSAEEMDVPHLVQGMLQLEDSWAGYLLKKTVGEDMPEFLSTLISNYEHMNQFQEETSSEQEKSEPWRNYVTCLNEGLQNRNPLIGRDVELERTIQVLCRKEKNNPLHVGEPGVGKTALAYGLAARIEAGNVPERLTGCRIYELDLGNLLAGTQYRGEFEKRLKAIMEGIRKEGHAIVYIDEIHNLIGAGRTGDGSMDASNMLKPYLEGGEIRFIGSTTYEEFNRYFSRSRGLVRRFQQIDIQEPGIEETIHIVEGLKEKYETFHGVIYEEGVIAYAVTAAARYISDRFLPDKAIDLVDEAGAYREIHPTDTEKQTVDKALITDILARICKVDVLAMLDEEIAHARNGEEAYAGFKLNSLTDKKIIDKLIEASEAGVKIDMVVRGICCLIPGVEGKTENIRIISIVGRFLEHSRIYIFGNSKRRKYYIASADFMTRNTVRRVEVAAPVYDERLQNKLQDMFDIMLADNQKARYLDAEGNYHRVINEEAPLNSQEYFYTQAYHEL